MTTPPTRTRRGLVLWGVALLLTLGAGYYQRRTGPTYPRDAPFSLAGETGECTFLRSGTTGEDAPVVVPVSGGGVQGALHYRRYGTDDDFTPLRLRRDGDRLVAALPSQPPAGKLEYFVRLEAGGESVRIPRQEGDGVVLRFKGAVPLAILLPHILMMFLSILLGLRTALAAIFQPLATRRLAWITLGGMTVGGLILGPIAQKYAFGELWTGWPRGYDLTDNKLLILWLVWVLACVVLGRRAGRRDRPGRVAVVGAALIMIVVYLIPHSLRGSELDYDRLDEGADPTDAIRTG